MRFVETPTFTRDLVGLLPDDEYRALQFALVLRPDAGALLKGGAGVRKLRWSVAGAGKRGGVRVIYYWVTAEDVIHMLTIYRKSRQEDLTPQQVRVLGKLVREELK